MLITGACGRVGFDAHDGAVTRDAGIDAYTGCRVVAAAAGREHTCALDEKGSVWCFGSNIKGQVLPNGPAYVVTPTKLALGQTVSQLVAGRFFSCARMSDGSVTCWGDGGTG